MTKSPNQKRHPYIVRGTRRQSLLNLHAETPHPSNTARPTCIAVPVTGPDAGPLPGFSPKRPPSGERAQKESKGGSTLPPWL